jgi:predicted Zn finger-like uncharacterized protein
VSVEVRCPSCGSEYLVGDSAATGEAGSFPCQTCGTMIEIRPAARPAAPPIAPPAAKAPVAPRPAAPAPSEVCCPRCGLHFIPDGAPAPRGARRTILLVEDLDYFIEIAKEALAGDYEIRTAGTVAEAKAVLSRGGIDLLLLDLTLAAGEDGLRVLRGPPGKTCPVLAFTARDEGELYGVGWERLRAAGVDDMIVKGINMGELLLRKVAELIGESPKADAASR